MPSTVYKKNSIGYVYTNLNKVEDSTNPKGCQW